MLIRQTESGRWELASADGTAIGEFDTYDAALSFLAGALTYDAAVNGLAPSAPDSSTLLPESWMSDQGIAFSENPGGPNGPRDFTQCAWSWRDPQMSLLPLMLQTQTDQGHLGAELAGYIQELHMLGNAPQASGRFYATDVGRAARDLLGDGRRFGVSVDPTEGGVDVEFTCTEEDADGYCVAGAHVFNAYEIGGLTMTPFPAFANASIIQSPSTVMAATVHVDGQRIDLVREDTGAVVATASVAVLERPAAPPRDWFETAEPAFGEPFALGSMGDEWLVDQGAGHVAMPFTIGEDRRLAGHLAYWGQCHSGYPGQCVTPPESASAYAHFHLGETIFADGSRLPTGSFVASCDHAITQMRAAEARDHYAHNGIAWADVRVTNGVYGPWACGTLRADVTAEQIAVLRAGTLSGDWRRLGGHLELITALAVNQGGFPIAREAITASGWEFSPAPPVSTRTVGGELEALVASGIVRRCPDCARRGVQDALQARTRPPLLEGLPGPLSARLDRLERDIQTLVRRTAPLVDQAAARLAAQIGRDSL